MASYFMVTNVCGHTALKPYTYIYVCVGRGRLATSEGIIIVRDQTIIIASFQISAVIIISWLVIFRTELQ